MKLFSIGIISIYFFFPILCSIFGCLRTVFVTNKFNHPLFQTLFMFFSESLCIIFEMISRCYQKRKISRNSTISIINNELFIEKTGIHIHSKIKYLKGLPLLLFSSLLDFGSFTLFTILGSMDTFNLIPESRIIPFIIMAFLTLYFLGYSLHRHHIVSLVLVLIGLFALMFKNLLKIKEPLYFTGFLLLAQLLISIKQVSDKHIMDKEYISPFILLTIEGTIGLLVTLISLFTFPNFFCKNSTCPEWNSIAVTWVAIKETFTDKNKLLFGFLVIFLSLIYNILLTHTIRYFTPSHRTISDTLSAIFSFVCLIIEISWNSIFILDFIGFVIVLFGCLLYNEIIIFHFWGLEYYTKQFIEKRSQEEALSEVHELFNQKENFDINSGSNDL